MGEYLLDLGYEVIEASNGRQGVEKIFSENPGLVLCDLRMPELDGLEVLKTVCPEKPNLPIVVISGAGLINDVIESLRLGAWDYLLKPINEPHALEHTIAKALERAQLLKIKEEYQRSLEKDFRQSQQDLRQSRETLSEKSGLIEALFKNIPVGVYYLNLEGDFLDVNPTMASFFQMARKEMVGRNLRDSPDFAPLSVPAKQVSEFHIRRFSVAGKVLDLGIKNAMVFSEKGSPIGIVGLVLDATTSVQAAGEAKKREQQVLQADKMISLGILTAGVAHEINNPTQVIMSNAPVVRKAWQGIRPILDAHADQHGDFMLAGLPYSRMGEKLDQLMVSIEEGADRIKAIVRDMKDFARFDAEDVRAPVDVNLALEKVLRLVKNKLEKCCHCLQINYGKSIPLVKANPVQLEQVFVNLILNAAEALPSADKAIDISTNYDPVSEKIWIEMRDEGLGMSPEVLKNLFVPFFTTKRDQGGTGLGLAVSSRIIEKHGGEINYVSVEGKGTTVTVHLPLWGGVEGKRGNT